VSVKFLSYFHVLVAPNNEAMIESILQLIIYKNAQDLNEGEARQLEQWLQEPSNTQRLIKEAQKILDNYTADATYEVDRAFHVVALRLLGELQVARR
jgi:hypothetical protein